MSTQRGAQRLLRMPPRMKRAPEIRKRRADPAGPEMETTAAQMCAAPGPDGSGTAGAEAKPPELSGNPADGQTATADAGRMLMDAGPPMRRALRMPERQRQGPAASGPERSAERSVGRFTWHCRRNGRSRMVSAGIAAGSYGPGTGPALSGPDGSGADRGRPALSPLLLKGPCSRRGRRGNCGRRRQRRISSGPGQGGRAEPERSRAEPGEG